MNELACVVHDLIMGERATHLNNLSQVERTVLEELQDLSRYSFEDVIDIWAADPGRWPTASIMTPTRSQF
jgi:hypothetical protein